MSDISTDAGGTVDTTSQAIDAALGVPATTEPATATGTQTTGTQTTEQAAENTTTTNADAGKEGAGNGKTGEAAAPQLPADVQAILDRYSRFAPVLDKLEESGLSDADAFNAGLAERDFQAALGTKQQELYDTYAARVENGELDDATATAMYKREAALLEKEMRVERDQQSIAARVAQSEIRAALDAPEAAPVKEWGGLGTSLVQLISQAGRVSLGEAAKHLGKALDETGQRAVAKYVADQEKNKTEAGPGAMGSGNGGAPPATDGARASSSASWSQLLGMK